MSLTIGCKTGAQVNKARNSSLRDLRKLLILPLRGLSDADRRAGHLAYHGYGEWLICDSHYYNDLADLVNRPEYNLTPSVGMPAPTWKIYKQEFPLF